MRALPDHRGGGIRGLTSRLGGIAPAAGASIVRSRLFIKYVALFVAVVSLVANGVFDVYFSYQEQKASLVRIQREQAEAAAGKIGQFISEIESQVGWTTQLPWSASNCIELGTSMPSALAVLRFTTSSNLVGACTGRSPGLAPFKMRSTYSAA